MKTVSIIALVAAFGMAMPAATFAQTVGGTVDSTVGVDADDDGVSVDVGVDADADADTGDVVDDVGDTVDDATDDIDDAVDDANDTADDMGDDTDVRSCAEFDLATMLASIDESQLAAIAAATSVSVAVLDDCTTDSEAEVGLVELDAALFANAVISEELTRAGVTSGEVIGASVEGDSVTVYASDDDDGDDDSSDDTDAE